MSIMGLLLSVVVVIYGGSIYRKSRASQARLAATFERYKNEKQIQIE